MKVESIAECSDSFEHPKQMLKLMNKKRITFLCTMNFAYLMPMEINSFRQR